MLAQHREARAHVLAALVVVRRGRQHRVRIARPARRCTRAWKSAASSAEGLDVEADVVAREQRGRSDRRRCPRPPWRRPARSAAGSASTARLVGGLGKQRMQPVDRPAVGRQAGRLRAPSAAGCSTARSAGVSRRPCRRCDRPGNAPASRSARGAAAGEVRSSPPAMRRRRTQASSWAAKLRATISRRAACSSVAKSAGRPLSAAQASAERRSPAASCCSALTSSMKS